MKLQLVSKHRAGTLSVPCAKCDKVIHQSRESVWADLDGPAFKAYYHEECVFGPRTTDQMGSHYNHPGSVPSERTV